MGNTLLEFKSLVTEFHTEGNTVKAIEIISNKNVPIKNNQKIS